MNIIDILGPVMIGPSSSHTAGAVRLGLLAVGVLGSKPVKAEIFLHGSFAETYKGHGTDMALLAGLMGWLPDDERIPNADKFAKESGLEFSFTKTDLGNLTHPNTAMFQLTAADGKKYRGTLVSVDDVTFAIDTEVMVTVEGKKRKQKEIQTLTFAYDGVKYTKYDLKF